MSVAHSLGTADAKIGATHRRRLALLGLRHLESTLIRGLADGQALADACARLRVATRPQGPGSKTRPLQEVLPARSPSFHFMADDASDFAGRRGKFNRKRMRESARLFRFEAVVTVRKTMEQGQVHFSISDGTRSILVAYKNRRDPNSGLVVVRRGNFKPRSGRAATSGRYVGKGPAGSSE